jgi:hypothetical protein
VEDSREHGNEPSGSITCCEIPVSGATGGFSRRTQLHRVRLFHLTTLFQLQRL